MKKQAIKVSESVLVKFIPNVTDFSKFKFLSNQNRKVDEGQVKKLVDSFTQFGVAGVTIIVIKSAAFSGKDELFIGDGQHSINAAKRLGLPIDVKIIKLVDDSPLQVTKFIAALNNNSKAWSTNNFLTAFSNNGIREYKKLANVKSEHGFTITDLLYIYLGNGSTKENKMFKNGTLKFIDENDSDNLMQAVASVKNVIPNKAFTRRSLYKVMRIAKDYKKFAKAIQEVAKHQEAACSQFSENEQEFYDHLVRIYQANFNTKKLAA